MLVPEQWSAEEEAAMREFEEEEEAIRARSALLANQKAKLKAHHLAGPTIITFHDDGVEYTCTTGRPAARGSLLPISDDKDDVEIERMLAPGVHSSPGSVVDRNV
jgi:hypothetical protein